MKLPAVPLSAALLALALFPPPVFAATYYYLQPYKDRTQNPFWQGVVDGTAYLEDFEDHELNTPFVSGFNGYIGGKTYRNVDGDDGLMDGKTLGYAWGSDAVGTSKSSYFDFSQNSKGELPRYVGAAAFLGAASISSDALSYGKILAYDANGVEITGGEWNTLIPWLPPGVSSVEAHSFSGIYYEGGISRVVFPDSFSIDHLTYGYTIPEPAAGALLLGALGVGVIRRRR